MSKNLEERLVKFSSMIIKMTDVLKGGYACSHLSHQIIRSATSCALNYGEAQNAQSRKDFIHKLSIVIKELRETYVNLKIIQQSHLCKDEELLKNTLMESDEMLAIFTKAIITAKKNEKLSGD